MLPSPDFPQEYKSKVLQTAASWENERERIKTAWEAVTGGDELDDLD